MYETVKLIHISTVVLTILGFMLRGYWMLTGSPNLRLRVTRIAPHVIDTVLLASGIALIVVLRLPVLEGGQTPGGGSVRSEEVVDAYVVGKTRRLHSRPF